MGACCSADAKVGVPDNVQPDPAENARVTVAISRIKGGFFRQGRDFAIYNGDSIPNDEEAKAQQMWMWMNKETDGPNAGRIDLENFDRPADDMENGKGKVLWSARVVEKPYYEQVQRQEWSPQALLSGATRFMGHVTGSDGYQSDDDNFYCMHPRFNKFQGIPKGPTIISKWMVGTAAEITRGNTGRGEEYFADANGADPIRLEVFAKGTGITKWTEHKNERRDDEGTAHVDIDIKKHEQEFVDRIEFRVVYKQEVWAEWSVEGDKGYNVDGQGQGESRSNELPDISMHNPFFSSTLRGGWSGWFNNNAYTTVTNKVGDPALAIMIAHLCTSEYSVDELKKDLSLKTPMDPPDMFQSMMGMAFEKAGVWGNERVSQTDKNGNSYEECTYNGNSEIKGRYEGDYFTQATA